MINKIKKTLKQLNLIDIFLIINPIIDIFTTFSVLVLKVEFSFGIIMRSLFLVFLFIYYLIKVEKKKNHILYFFIFLLYSSIFFYDIICTESFSNLFLEIKGFVKVFYFPIIFMLFIQSLNNKKKFLNNNITFSAFMYSFFIFVPYLLNLSLLTYSNGKSGSIGWFYAPNEVGAILGIVSPIFVYTVMKFKRKILTIFALYVYIMAISLIGTKVPIFALIISLSIMFIIYLTKGFFSNENRKRNQCKASVILLTILCSVLIINYISPIKNNIKSQIEWNNDILTTNPNIPDEIYEIDKNLSEEEQEKKIEVKIKQKKILNLIFSSRDNYVIQRIEKWVNSGNQKIIFGMGIYQDKVQQTVEIDFFDILFSYGILGTLIYFMPLIILFLKMIIYFVRNLKTFFINDELWVYYISLALAISISFTAGHVLIAPAVSLFVAIVASKIILSQIK